MGCIWGWVQTTYYLGWRICWMDVTGSVTLEYHCQFHLTKRDCFLKIEYSLNTHLFSEILMELFHHLPHIKIFFAAISSRLFVNCNSIVWNQQHTIKIREGYEITFRPTCRKLISYMLCFIKYLIESVWSEARKNFLGY